MLAKTKFTRDDDTPSGNYMNDKQFTEYLADLRTSRAARLNGSRPVPVSRYASHKSLDSKSQLDCKVDNQHSGGPLVPEPLKTRSLLIQEKELNTPRSPLGVPGSPNAVYLENGTRWMEKQEARSLRMALEDMDLSDEARIHEAAQDEASKLVLEHRSGSPRKKESAFANPDLPPRDYRVHLRRGSYGRSHGPMVFENNHGSAGDAEIDNASEIKKSHMSPGKGVLLESTAESALSPPPSLPSSPKKKGYQGLANAVAADIANIKRRVSSGSKRKFSSEKRMFPTTEDKIYEEPEPIREEEEITPQPEQRPDLIIPPFVLPSPAPADHDASEPARHVRKNPFARFTKDKLERASSIASTSPTRFNPVEIQKNPPTQSRRPWYMANKPVSAPAVPKVDNREAEQDDHREQSAVGEKEIRSADIRAATSMRRKDRSQNLPQPTAVSGCPGRPIVSFQNDWTMKEAQREAHSNSRPSSSASVRQQSRPGSSLSSTGFRSPFSRPSDPRAAEPTKQHPKPAAEVPAFDHRSTPNASSIPNGIPILNLPDDDGGEHSKVLSEEPDLPHMDLLHSSPGARKQSSSSVPFDHKRPSVPTISIGGVATTPTSVPQGEQEQAARPLPVPTQVRAPKPARHQSIDHGSVVGSHMTPIDKRNASLCAQCALPIAGRILSAAGERFHPECFACHQCGINLECVAFYPEPDQKYYERIARIQHRRQGFETIVPEGVTEEDIRRLEEQDGDESMRFFCHLDFHELFSPRCRSCKTPIEGEVVVACGAEWHVGHFFCAQCGDPFDSRTPFVEKEGYAWCLGCHTHRYSPKCKKCRKPITEIVVNALGQDWHGDCFCCCECGGGFDDGQYFLRGDSADPVCIKCEERRLKA